MPGTVRLLAFSDIHGDRGAVHWLREIEPGAFDAVIVAGDILGLSGREDGGAEEMVQALSLFGAPVLFVLGNWDSEVPYDEEWAPSIHHIHHRVVAIGHLRFVGMSGVVQDWGLHPIAAEVLRERSGASRTRHDKDQRARRLKHPEPWPGLNLFEVSDANREISQKNRAGLINVIGQGDAARTVIVTHDRLYRMHEEAPGVPLYLFGHKHERFDHSHHGSRFLNVSLLDRYTADSNWERGGRYFVIEIDTNITVHRRRLYDDEDWAEFASA